VTEKKYNFFLHQLLEAEFISMVKDRETRDESYETFLFDILHKA
jgi:hypothetical protein